MNHLLSGSITCPKCGYGDCIQIHRNRFDKFLRRGRKFMCNNCHHIFFIKKKKRHDDDG